MNFLRQFLVNIRSWYYNDTKRALAVLFVILGVSSVAGFLLDWLVEFGGIWTIFRSLLLLPTAGSLFALGYMLALHLGRRKEKLDPDWVPIRARFSPKRRTQIAVIVGAVLLVVIYALAAQPGYTFLSSAVIASLVGVLAFVRRTEKEINRLQLGIPDPRDYDYDEAVRKRQAARDEKLQARENARKVKRERTLKGRKAADDLEQELLEES